MAGWGSEGWKNLRSRRTLGSVLVAALLATSATALAADESTTTTTTTTAPSTTTTTVPSSTTTTEPQIATPGPGDVGRFDPGTIVFPVVGPNSFTDTFGAPRDGGARWHEGTDIIADKGIPIVAVADGVIVTVSVGGLAGQYIIIRHAGGWTSKYVHLNNDTPGTDDGQFLGYAKGMVEGLEVEAGTVIGYVGDSGNAENTVPHLHFAIDQPDGRPINPYPVLVKAVTGEVVEGRGAPGQPRAGNAAAAALPAPAVETENTELVGHLDPDGTGFNAGIAVSGGHAYMGTWGRPGHCPATGVRVIDVSDPAKPSEVSTLAAGEEFAGTAAEAVWVDEVDTPAFEGRLAIVAVSLCENNWRGRAAAEFAGFALYDVTKPAKPKLLSKVHTGESTQGVHHIDVLTGADRLLAAVTVPQSHLHHPDGLGDVRVYDVTDPSAVEAVSDWDLRRDGPKKLVANLLASVGDEALSGHSVTWADENTLVVAHSAAGLVTVDVTNPETPTYERSASPFRPAELAENHEFGKGHGHNAHSGWVSDGQILIQDDQYLSPGSDEEWGQQVFYELGESGKAVQVATFGTENSRAGEDGEVRRDGFYSAHNSMIFGVDKEIVAWFSDGVRIVDLQDAANPTEVASFVPPPTADPQGWWVAPDGNREFAMVWGVVADGDTAYVSDANSGLWIFRVTVDPSEETTLD